MIPKGASGAIAGVKVQVPETALMGPVGAVVPMSERVVKETKRDQPLTFAQPALVVTSSTQPFGIGGKDARALADLALPEP